MRRSSSLQPRSLVAGGAFNALGAGARADLESISVDCRLPCGVALFHENTPGTHVLLIHSGRVKLPCTSRDDRTLLLKVAVPGDILGLSAVVSRSCYEVTARTIAPKAAGHSSDIRSLGDGWHDPYVYRSSRKDGGLF